MSILIYWAHGRQCERVHQQSMGLFANFFNHSTTWIRNVFTIPKTIFAECYHKKLKWMNYWALPIGSHKGGHRFYEDTETPGFASHSCHDLWHLWSVTVLALSWSQSYTEKCEESQCWSELFKLFEHSNCKDRIVVFNIHIWSIFKTQTYSVFSIWSKKIYCLFDLFIH